MLEDVGLVLVDQKNNNQEFII